MAAYERLSGIDELFLGFETANAHMHVAVTALLDARPVRTPDGGIDLERVRTHIAGRLCRIPRFRQRLAHVPLVGDALWVDDERFELAYHVRPASLPRPGTTAQLQQRCAEILERPLNRQRPLWEAWVIEGVEGDRFALLVKVHHCIVDGVAGIGVLAALLDPTPAVDPPADVVAWRPRPAPTARDLVRDEIARRLRGTVAAGQAVREAVAARVGVAGVVPALRGLLQLVRTGLSPAPAVFFNRPIGPHRRIAWLSLDLEALRTVRRQLGGTINDVVLTVVSGALGDLLARHDAMPPGGTLRAAVPVSVRSAEEMGSAGNRVSVWLLPLPVREPRPRDRFARIARATAELKAGRQAAGGTLLTEVANWAGGATVELAARALNGARVYNLIVTNVPGPSIPLYFLGAPIHSLHPHLPLFEQQGLGIALLSYCGQLHVGLTVDWDHEVLLADLMVDLPRAFAALVEAAAPRPAVVDAPARADATWRTGTD